MDGVPWELFELPRGQRLESELFNPNGPSSSTPAPRKQRSRKKMKENATGLDTISERAPAHKVPSVMRDAATSTSDLTTHGSGGEGGGVDDGRPPQKALQKQQINALGRMLSALRR